MKGLALFSVMWSIPETEVASWVAFVELLLNAVEAYTSDRQPGKSGKEEVGKTDTWENKGFQKFLCILGNPEGHIHMQS